MSLKIRDGALLFLKDGFPNGKWLYFIRVHESSSLACHTLSISTKMSILMTYNVGCVKYQIAVLRETLESCMTDHVWRAKWGINLK